MIKSKTSFQPKNVVGTKGQSKTPSCIRLQVATSLIRKTVLEAKLPLTVVR